MVADPVKRSRWGYPNWAPLLSRLPAGWFQMTGSFSVGPTNLLGDRHHSAIGCPEESSSLYQPLPDRPSQQPHTEAAQEQPEQQSRQDLPPSLEHIARWDHTISPAHTGSARAARVWNRSSVTTSTANCIQPRSHVPLIRPPDDQHAGSGLDEVRTILSTTLPYPGKVAGASHLFHLSVQESRPPSRPFMPSRLATAQLCLHATRSGASNPRLPSTLWLARRSWHR
jgi:hypothetical protein